jgi:hypothetical protein
MLFDIVLPGGEALIVGGSASARIVPPRRAGTVEATSTPSGDIGARLDVIEASVAAGGSLAGSGFWPLVATVKADPALIEAHADRIGRIDAAAFRAAVAPRFPVWLGNLTLLGAIAAGVVALVWASAIEGLWAGLLVVAAAVAWSVGVHSPAHWVVGRIVGIGFTDYFFGGPPPPRPGIKTDYATYLRTSARRRAWFHASGAIATKIAPFLVLAIAPLVGAPGWALLAVLAIGMIQIATDAAFSTKTSDWKRFRREMAFARHGG